MSKAAKKAAAKAAAKKAAAKKLAAKKPETITIAAAAAKLGMRTAVVREHITRGRLKADGPRILVSEFKRFEASLDRAEAARDPELDDEDDTDDDDTDDEIDAEPIGIRETPEERRLRVEGARIEKRARELEAQSAKLLDTANDTIQRLASHIETILGLIADPIKHTQEASKTITDAALTRAASLETSRDDMLAARESALSDLHERELAGRILTGREKRKDEAAKVALDQLPALVAAWSGMKEVDELFREMNPAVIQVVLNSDALTDRQKEIIRKMTKKHESASAGATTEAAPATEGSGAGGKARPKAAKPSPKTAARKDGPASSGTNGAGKMPEPETTTKGN